MNTDILYLFFLSFVLELKVSYCGVVDNNEMTVAGRGIDAKSIISTLASNLLSRGYYPTAAAAGSQIVSLNLSNLLVLVLLKALIFAAGSIGLGHLKEKDYGYYGRSSDQISESGNRNLVVTEDEMLLYLGYLTGNHGCLQNIACQQPDEAKKYTDAAELLLRGVKLFSIETETNYEQILKEMEGAVKVGKDNGDCSVFTCNHNDFT